MEFKQQKPQKTKSAAPDVGTTSFKYDNNN